MVESWPWDSQIAVKKKKNSNQVKSKMAADNMSNIHVSPDVLSTLMLLQQDDLHELQQQILPGISRSSRLEVFCDKATLKT